MFGLPVSVHAYISAAGDTAPRPHTDPYDTVVLQPAGSKRWTTCIPEVKMLGKTAGVELSSADLAQLHEIEINRTQGCTSFNYSTLDKMRCTTFTLDVGDTLYMPKGIVHYATNQINQEDGAAQYESIHLTLGMDRKGSTWQSVWQAATDVAVRALPGANGRRQSIAEKEFVKQLQMASSAAFETPGGRAVVRGVATVGVGSHIRTAAAACPHWSNRDGVSTFRTAIVGPTSFKVVGLGFFFKRVQRVAFDGIVH